MVNVYAFFAFLASLSLANSAKTNPVLKVPGYGTLTGKTIKTSGLLGRQPKTYYAYRNLTYAKSVSGDKRFLVRDLLIFDPKKMLFLNSPFLNL